MPESVKEMGTDGFGETPVKVKTCASLVASLEDHVLARASAAIAGRIQSGPRDVYVAVADLEDRALVAVVDEIDARTVVVAEP